METFLKIVGLVASVFILGLLFNYPLMWAINYLFASSFLLFVFGVAKLTFWRTYVLSIVINLLITSRSSG